MWTIKVLSSSTPVGSDKTRIRTAGLQALLRRCKNLLDDKSRDGPTMLLCAFYSLRLPHAGLLEMIVPYLLDERITYYFSRFLNEIEGQPRLLDDLFTDRRLNRRARGHALRVVNTLSAEADIHSDSFMRMALSVSMVDQDYPLVLRRILRRNTSLKLSLPLSWDSSIDAVDSRAFARAGSRNPLSARTLAFLNDLAIACACVPTTNLRLAFRRVCDCYGMLWRYGAPIRPVITQALYHVGVTRLREKRMRVPPMRFRWIMALVEKVEGPDVADRLRGYQPSQSLALPK